MNSLKKNQCDRGGIVRTVLLIIVALIILGYFGFNLRDILKSPTVHDNLIYAKELTVTGWNKYLKGPAEYVWGDFFKPLIWSPFINTLERMKDGGPAVTADQVPKLSTSTPTVR